MFVLCRKPLLPLLFLLAGAQAWGAGPIFNILDYGAHNDGSVPATEAIRSAIQAAKAAGGGTVYVPAGNYVTGPVELVSNMVLHIDAGATLRFLATRLPFTRGRVQGIECITPVPLIGGRKLENVTITGRGVLTTDNAAWLNLMSRPQPKTATEVGSAFGPAWNRLLELLQQKTPQPEEEYEKVAPFLRPSFFLAMESKNITIEGVHFVGSPFWPIHLLYSENVVIRDVTLVDTLESNASTFGGIYIDSSRNVRIANCDIETGDDAITLKAGKDADGLRVNRPTENVAIANCIIHRASGGLALGSETSGSIRNVVVDNMIFQGTRTALSIKSERGRGGVVEDVTFNNATMDGVGRAISITQYYQMRGEDRHPQEPVSQRTPVFRNISISHIVINNCGAQVPVGGTTAAAATINIEGLPEMPISGLRISDIVASGKGGLTAHDTQAMELHQVQMNPDSGPAFLLRDSKDLELDGLSTRKPSAGAPVIRLDRCPGAIVRRSRAFTGTGTFLSVAPGELKSVVLEGNSLSSAQKAAEESAADLWHAPTQAK